jgi:hypothetical protein
MLQYVKNPRSWLSLLLAVVTAIPAVTGIASQSAHAASPPENPAFTVDNVLGGRTLQLAFTPVSGIAHYTVRGYTNRDNYDSVQFVQSNYQPGQELGSGANDVIAYSIAANPLKFTIQGFDSSNNPVTSPSPKSIPYFSTEGASFQLTSPVEISASVIRVPFTPKTGQSSMAVRLFRSDNYLEMFREVTGITAGGKDIEVPGNYSYKYQYRFVGSTINNIGYLTSHWRDSNQTLRVPAHPNPPSNIRLTGDNKSVSVSFDAPQAVTGADVFQYGVSISTDKISWTNFGTYDTFFSLSSLTNGQPYWIKVQTVAVGGAIGEWISPTPITPSFTPLIPALTLLAGNERIDATWLAPDSDGGAPVLSYLLQYSTDGSSWTDITLDSTKRTHSITGLVNGTQYTVRIYARNTAGLSVTNQSAIRATPVGSPVPQTEAVTKIDTTRATIGMSVDSKGNTLTPYLQYGPAGSYNTPISGAAAKGDNVTFTYDISGLTPGYWYQARSGVRIGTTPTNGTELTFTTTPNAPTGLSANMTGTTAAVTWDYFTTNRGGYIKYQVWAEQNGLEVGNRCTTFTLGGNNCEITGLAPGKNYVVKATARATGANYGNGTSVAANLNVATLAPQTILFSFGTLSRKGSQSISSSFDASSFVSTSSGLQVSLATQTSAKCDVAGTVITILRSGTCTIRASQNGNSKYIAATSVDASFVIASTQTITFSVSSIGTQTFGGSTLNASSLASATSGLTVSFTSTTPSICTVSDTTITYVGAGKCRVVASQEGDENYDPAPNIAREITVNKGTQSTLTVSSTTGTYSTELLLTTSGGSGAGMVSYAIDTNSGSATATGCSITSDGLISTSAGTCAVIATKADDVNYLSKTSASTLITLQKAAQTIAFVPIAGSGTLLQVDGSGSLLQGGSLTASAQASSGLSVTISSDTESKCTVSGTTVSLVADGTCTLRGTQSGTSNFNAATDATTSFEISPKPIPETSAIVYTRRQSPDTYRVGDVVALSIAPPTYLGSVIPGTYEFIPTIPGSVTFGEVTIDADGTTRTTANLMKTNQAFHLYAVFTPTDTVNFAQAQAFAPITVNGKLQNIVVNDDISEYNQTRSITFNGIESTGRVNIDLSPTTPQGQSANPEDQWKHCTISNQTVTRDNSGFCYVRISALGDGEFEEGLGIGTFYFTKLSQTVVMTNTDQLDSLTAENIGDTIDLTSIATSSSTLTVVVSSQTTSICTVSDLTLTVVSAGTCEIIVQQSGNGEYLAVSDLIYSFNILALEQESISLTSTSTTFGTPLTLTASGGSGTGQFSFIAIDGLATGCSVQNGTLTSTSSGSCLVSVTRASDSSYLSKSTTPILVEITRAAQSIQTDVASIQTVQIGNAPIDLTSFVATSSGSSVSLRVNDERICTVTGHVLTLLELGTCSFTASQDGTDNFEPATDVVVTLTVIPQVEPIIVPEKPKTENATIAKTENTTIAKTQLKAPRVPATVTTSRILKFTMKTSSGTPLTVSASGTCKVSKITKVITTRVKAKGKMALKKSKLQTGWSLSFPKRGKCRATFRSSGNQYFFPLAVTKQIRVK